MRITLDRYRKDRFLVISQDNLRIITRSEDRRFSDFYVE